MLFLARPILVLLTSASVLFAAARCTCAAPATVRGACHANAAAAAETPPAAREEPSRRCCPAKAAAHDAVTAQPASGGETDGHPVPGPCPHCEGALDATAFMGQPPTVATGPLDGLALAVATTATFVALPFAESASCLSDLPPPPSSTGGRALLRLHCTLLI